MSAYDDAERATDEAAILRPMSADPVVEPAEKMLASALDNARLPNGSWAADARAMFAASPELKACIELGRRIRDENDPLLADAIARLNFDGSANSPQNIAQAADLRAALLRATEKGESNDPT